MKKILLALSLVLVLALAACGGNNDDTANANNGSEETTIKVGASSVPHAEILEEAQPILKEKGINLEIEEYEDYVLPNDDLDSGEIDANYFQHVPYMEQTIEDTGYDIVSIGGVHVEAMAGYSQDIKDLDDIKDGTEVVLSNSVAEHGRVLGLLQAQGLIELKDGVDEESATIDDIAENPKNLKFSPDYEPAFLPEIYESESDIITIINANYAIQAGLNPIEDSLFIEDSNSPYVNIITVRAEDEDNEALNTLVEVLQSEEIQDFMVEKYDGAVVPATN